MVPRIPAQTLGPLPALGHAKKARICEFTARGVLVHALSGFRAAPFDIEQIIGNLKSLAEAATVVIQALQQFHVRPALSFSQNGPGTEPEAGPKQRSRLAGMKVFQGLQGIGARSAERGAPFPGLGAPRCALPRKVLHLPADHAGGTGSACQLPATSRRGGWGIAFRQDLKGQREQSVARQDGHRLPETLMTGGQSTTKVIVVHRW